MTVFRYKSGYTLVEAMLAVVIIGMLAAALVPAINLMIRSRQNAECADKIRTAVEAFELYATDTGKYPLGSSPGTIPSGMADYYFPYFKIDWWGKATELGGSWGWNVDQGGIHLSVSINSPTKESFQLQEFDRLVDDGNLASGRFRQVGTQYHYIIEE